MSDPRLSRRASTVFLLASLLAVLLAPPASAQAPAEDVLQAPSQSVDTPLLLPVTQLMMVEDLGHVHEMHTGLVGSYCWDAIHRADRKRREQL